MGLFVFLFILGIIFAVYLIITRNSLFSYCEEIKNAKSKVNTIKAKYLKVQKKSLIMAGKAMRNESSEYKGFKDISVEQLYALGQQYPDFKDKFTASAELIEKLYTEYQKAQENLNRVITTYNQYLGTFPRNIAAWLLGYVREEVIGEEMLDKAKDIEFEEDIEGDEYL